MMIFRALQYTLMKMVMMTVVLKPELPPAPRLHKHIPDSGGCALAILRGNVYPTYGQHIRLFNHSSKFVIHLVGLKFPLHSPAGQ